MPTATFRILFVFLVLSNDRRQILHFNVTDHPTAQWTGRQLPQACGPEENLQYLIRDRDAIYVGIFQRQAEVLGIAEVVTAAGSPWQNAYAERVIGSIRREFLDHMFILGERHLKYILSKYVQYYNGCGPQILYPRQKLHALPSVRFQADVEPVRETHVKPGSHLECISCPFQSPLHAGKACNVLN